MAGYSPISEHESNPRSLGDIMLCKVTAADMKDMNNLTYLTFKLLFLSDKMADSKPGRGWLQCQSSSEDPSPTAANHHPEFRPWRRDLAFKRRPATFEEVGVTPGV
ncbi:hypothetical protein SRHO_G00105750 [Serrasalmus rhombeus]